MVRIGNDWDELLKDEWDKSYYRNLRSFLIDEYDNETVYPLREDIFNALKLTPYSEVKVVILGQDPYHEPGQAHGLAFSVPRGAAALPPSLLNILKELESDVGVRQTEAGRGGHGSESKTPGVQAGRDVSRPDIRTPGAVSTASDANAARENAPDKCGENAIETGGILDPWAREGVLLLNTVLTVRAHRAGSHRGAGWEQFTDRVIELLAEREQPMAFVLWGAQAISKKDLILKASSESSAKTQALLRDESKSQPKPEPGAMRHLIITAPHPSPLSAYRGFFGGRYFSRCNYFLQDNGIEPVMWSLT